MKVLHVSIVLLFAIHFAKGYSIEEIEDAISNLPVEKKRILASDLMNSKTLNKEDETPVNEDDESDEMDSDENISNDEDAQYKEEIDEVENVADDMQDTFDDELDQAKIVSNDDNDETLEDALNEKLRGDPLFFRGFWLRRRSRRPKPAPKPTKKPSGVTGKGRPTGNKVSCLSTHNKYRRKHQNTPDMVWNSDIERGAQQWANKLAKTNKMKHDSSIYGENIYAGYASLSAACERATKMWYDEIKDYNFNRPGYSSTTGHFTQVVWKASVQLGVGIARSSSGRVFVVGRYAARGNVMSQFRQNVMPLK